VDRRRCGLLRRKRQQREVPTGEREAKVVLDGVKVFGPQCRYLPTTKERVGPAGRCRLAYLEAQAFASHAHESVRNPPVPASGEGDRHSVAVEDMRNS
jgi:hypothetical protein